MGRAQGWNCRHWRFGLTTTQVLKLAAGCWLLLGVVTVQAKQNATQLTPAMQARVAHITDQLRCPTCQAVSVRDSEAAFSVQIRQKVQRMVLEGQNETQIKAFFTSRYGDWILRAPPPQGIGIVAWAAPLLALALGGGWLCLRTIQHAHKTPRAPPKPHAKTRASVLEDIEHFEKFAD